MTLLHAFRSQCLKAKGSFAADIGSRKSGMSEQEGMCSQNFAIQAPRSLFLAVAVTAFGTHSSDLRLLLEEAAGGERTFFFCQGCRGWRLMGCWIDMGGCQNYGLCLGCPKY